MSEELPGQTVMNLNANTMNRIVQEYLQEHGGALMDGVTVNSIAADTNNSFLVVLESKVKPGVLKP